MASRSKGSRGKGSSERELYIFIGVVIVVGIIFANLAQILQAVFIGIVVAMGIGAVYLIYRIHRALPRSERPTPERGKSRRPSRNRSRYGFEDVHVHWPERSPSRGGRLVKRRRGGGPARRERFDDE